MQKNLLATLSAIMFYFVLPCNSQTVVNDEVLENYNNAPTIMVEEKTILDTFDVADINKIVYPLPIANPSLRLLPSDNLIMSFDLRNGERTSFKLTIDSTLENLRQNKISSSTSSIKESTFRLTSFDDLVKIENTQRYPFNAITKLFIHFPSLSPNSFAQGSGVIIDPHHVLTAAHCIFDHEHHLGMADQILAIPGYNGGSSPYGRYRSVRFFTFSNWIDRQDWNHDLGILELENPITVSSDLVKIEDPETTSWNWTFINPGYPAASPYNGQFMFSWKGHFDDFFPERVYQSKKAFGGQSGSPAYHVSMQLKIIISAICSHTTADGRTGYTLITPIKNTFIQNTIQNTLDRIGRIPVLAISDLTTSEITIEKNEYSALDKIGPFKYAIMNYSSLPWNGEIIIRLYLSTNSQISTSDLLLQTRRVITAINPREHVLVEASQPFPEIPAGISGKYWLGIILDVKDANIKNNNTDYLNSCGLQINDITAVREDDNCSNEIQFNLLTNFPNPFNATTTIAFTLLSKSFVSLKIFDRTGKEVATLFYEQLQAGRHLKLWNANDLPSGIYFYRLQAGEMNETKKLTLLK